MAYGQWRETDERSAEAGPAGLTAVDDSKLRVLALQAADVQDQFVLLERTVKGDEQAMAVLAQLKRLWRGFLDVALMAATGSR